ncbi:MAG TPA: aminodeoxychorismate synthase component I [Microbacterium sp.]|nr:aminodeoxychorismate synthase component I [Microbacterium sp.]
MPPPFSAAPLSGWTDPAVLFAGWVAGSEHGFWLDAGPDATDGWSWLGMGAPDDERSVRSVALTGRAPADGAAGPFSGGWVGWIGYERGAAAAGAPVTAEPGEPPSVWLRAERFIAVDHAARRLWAVSARHDDDAWVDEMRLLAASRIPRAHEAAPDLGIAHARHLPDRYAALIERCRDAIREGDAYQLCLTTRFSVAGEVDPAATYLRLRALTPAHHGGYVRSGDTALLSASPERFLQVGEGVARTRPIKGTRPRGADAQEDAALAAELRASVKERAENVMIVDLMRNDLSRVSAPGSIRVEGLLEVESYAAVHQLVSTVSSRLRPGTTAGDLLDAAFPAGSMTGAPKLSAMTILHRLEGGPRGVFAGCFGYVGHDGTIDLAMIIRSIVTRPGGAYVGAGGGITWGSEARAEVAEVGIKARAPLAALGAVLPPGW